MTMAQAEQGSKRETFGLTQQTLHFCLQAPLPDSSDMKLLIGHHHTVATSRHRLGASESTSTDGDKDLRL
jgi:hypothetical protein